MAHTFQRFSDLSTKAYEMEVHLNNKKKPAKGWKYHASTVHPKAGRTFNLGAGSSKGWAQQQQSSNNPPQGGWTTYRASWHPLVEFKTKKS